MNKHTSKAIGAILLLAVLIWLLNTKYGVVPPLGKILSPSEGLWQNAERRKIKPEGSIVTGSVGSDVLIKYDRNRVPHLFAENEHDLYFAQGYITAKDRLWQMEMQARQAAGTLSEIFGMRLLQSDISMRRIGLFQAARQSLDSAMKDPRTAAMLEAYSEGVNAYVKKLKPADYPLEYKMIDRQPMTWKPVYSLAVLKLMAEKLTGGEAEFRMANGLEKLGMDTIKELIGEDSNAYPVIPRHSPWKFSPLPVGLSEGTIAGNIRNDDRVIGSNNWAVSGSKTQSGYPVLANDPHLELTFPGIWYQLQMNGPGINVYGVSIPGIPCIMIGYNKDIAWGITNTSADVVDWYRIRFRDRTRQEYWYDDQWHKVTKRIERFYPDKGGVITDTLLYTHQGPVVYDGSHRNRVYMGPAKEEEGFAMKWVLHQPSNDIKAFYFLNRAKNYVDFRQALTDLFCPAQNVVFADADKDIAMVCEGKYPLKYKDQGEFILDGSQKRDDWKGWIPMDEVPFTKNPENGFVCSANQPLTDSSYPYYIGGAFASEERAKRINIRLSSMKNINADSFRLLQLDTYRELAEAVYPVMLRRLKQSGIKVDKQLLMEMEGWDYKYTENSVAATLFDAWWRELYMTIWRNSLPGPGMTFPWPDFERTAAIIKTDTNSRWMDDAKTPQKETLTDVIASSYKAAMDKLIRKNGNLGDNWTWNNSDVKTIRHISGIPSFGLPGFKAGGAANTINALAGGFGPSWRMVVELGPHVRGYGILPGGESGNPGSFYYDNSFPSWKEGKLDELIFLSSREQANDAIIDSITLKK
ncbi:MAG TPA: penicillin acylase family protein [Puia sp.]|jgi:penicillin amidase|nr:penicillin acylase family protein [Puia sp.]